MKNKSESNYNHHFDYWKDTYSGVKIECAHDVIRLKKIIFRMVERERLMKHYDCSRREHAVRMGVGIKESDEKLCFDEELKDVLIYIKESKAAAAQMGVHWEDLIKEDSRDIDVQ